jgi:transposase
MEFFAGLDVGMDETAICVVDDKGKAALEVTVVTDPEAIKAALKPYLGRLRRVGHEAGALSPWLHPELLKLGLPAICLETQHVRAAMSAQRNKTRQGGCARPGAPDAHRLVQKSAHQERKLLPAATVVDAPPQPEAQVFGP